MCINRPKHNRAIQNNKRRKENKIRVWNIHTHTHLFVRSCCFSMCRLFRYVFVWLSFVRESLQKVILCSNRSGSSSSEQWITNKFPSPLRIVYLQRANALSRSLDRSLYRWLVCTFCFSISFLFRFGFLLFLPWFFQLLVLLLHLFAYCFCAARRFSVTGGRERARARSFTRSFREQMNANNWWNKENTCLLRATYQPFQITWIKLYGENFVFIPLQFLFPQRKYTLRMWNKFWLAFEIIFMFCVSSVEYHLWWNRFFFPPYYFSSSSENSEHYCVVTPIFFFLKKYVRCRLTVRLSIIKPVLLKWVYTSR